MIRRPPRSTLDRSSAASDVYKRQQYSPGFNAWIAIDIDTLRTNYMEPYGNEVIIGVKAGWFDGSSGINFGIITDNAIGDDNDVDLVPSFGTASYITYNFEPNWLFLDLQNGTIPSGSSQDIIATFDGSGMLGGEYFADINVATCLLYTSPSPRDATLSRMPSSA